MYAWEKNWSRILQNKKSLHLSGGMINGFFPIFCKFLIFYAMYKDDLHKW